MFEEGGELGVGEHMDRLKEELVSDLGSAKRELEAAGFSVNVTAEFSEPAAVTARRAERGVDLIALATHGRSGLSRMLMGRVAETVLRTADVPVLMVHPVEKRSGETLPLTRAQTVRGGA